jgi:hypothetical protein
MNIKTQSVEARFCVSVVHQNEGLIGYLELINEIEEMSGWKVSKSSVERLIKYSDKKKSETTRNYYKKRMLLIIAVTI